MKTKKKYNKLLSSLLLVMIMMLSMVTMVSAATMPTGLTATAYDSEIHLNWNDTVDGKYYVYRSPDNVTYTKLNATAITSSYYVDSSVTNGTLYYYKVSSFDGTAESSQTAMVSATPTVGAKMMTNLTTTNVTTEATNWAGNFDNVVLVAVGIGVAFMCVRFVVRLF